MSGRVVLAAVAVLAVVAATAGAANLVQVESLSCDPGESIAVGVLISNDVELRALTIPLIIKSVTPFSYITALTLTNPVTGSRMEGHLGDVVVSSTYPVGDAALAGCNSEWYADGGGFATSGAPDYLSPDGVLFIRQSILGSNLPPGSDSPFTPSFRLNLTVTDLGGDFEIDTTCVTPGNHLSYVDASSQQVTPSFTKGVIHIDAPPQPPADAAVVVQSLFCYPGDEISVGIYTANDFEAYSVVIPLEIREVTSGSYISSLQLVNPVPGSRMVDYLSDIVVSNTYPLRDAASPPCLDGYQTIGLPDYISPDGLMLARQRIQGLNLPPGSDFSFQLGVPSFRLDMTVTETPGVFEIDTTCVTPANRLLFVAITHQGIRPSFTKGTITICPCPWQGDFDEDGDIDAVDLAREIDIVFFGGLDIQDPGCPTSRCDWNADGFVDAVDLAKWINYVFFGGADPMNPCE
ncbi:MAG: dockerin type I domain-containing protein [Candidatus Zixiibacteriota bacterium]